MFIRISCITLLAITSIGGSSLDAPDLPTVIDQQIGQIEDLIGHQGEVDRLFTQIASAFPKCVKSDAPAASETRKKLRTRLAVSGKISEEQPTVASPLDDLRSDLLQELSQVGSRPVRLATLREVFIKARKETPYIIEEGLFFLKASHNVMSYLSERIAAGSNILRVVAGMPYMSKNARTSLTARIQEYIAYAQFELERQTRMRDILSNAVRFLIQKQKAAEKFATAYTSAPDSRPGQEVSDALDTILETFIMIDEMEFDPSVDAIVVSRKDLETTFAALESAGKTSLMASSSDEDDYDWCDVVAVETRS